LPQPIVASLEPELAAVWDRTRDQVTVVRHDLAGPAASSPVAAPPAPAGLTFPRMTDPGLRTIVERDYVELLRATEAQCWKSVIIVAGGTIEGILTDVLQARSAAALASPKRNPRSSTDIGEWKLVWLIDVALDLGVVGTAISKLSDAVRQFRNLVHPTNELRNKLTFGEPEAKVALETVRILHRDLVG
jgi:hypothetical protein